LTPKEMKGMRSTRRALWQLAAVQVVVAGGLVLTGVLTADAVPFTLVMTGALVVSLLALYRWSATDPIAAFGVAAGLMAVAVAASLLLGGFPWLLAMFGARWFMQRSKLVKLRAQGVDVAKLLQPS
jgi:hypothetical protein